MLDIFIALVFIIGAALSALGLWLARGGIAENSYIDSREADATHLLMNATMAIMLTSLYTTVAAHVITILYWLGAAALATRTVLLFRQTGARKTAGEGAHIGGSIYHLFMICTMLYALRLMPPAAGQGVMAMPDMAMPSMAPMPSMPPSWPAIVLGVIFLLDAATSFVMVVVFPKSLQRAQLAFVTPEKSTEAPLPSAYTSLSLLRLSLVPHLLMDIGMAYMLLSF